MTLQTYLDSKNITKYHLSKISGVPKTTILDICAGRSSLERCSARTVRQLAKALGCSMEDIMAMAEEQPETEEPETEEPETEEPETEEPGTEEPGTEEPGTEELETEGPETEELKTEELETEEPATEEPQTEESEDDSYLECGLPPFLQESVEAMAAAWQKLDAGEEYLRWDCDYCSLQSDINNAEVNQLISSEQAWYLREKYLGMERVWPNGSH